MKKINEDKIDNIVGGQEPEEFDWHTKGYVTPEKPPIESGWEYESIEIIKKNQNKNKEN